MLVKYNYNINIKTEFFESTQLIRTLKRLHMLLYLISFFPETY